VAPVPEPTNRPAPAAQQPDLDTPPADVAAAARLSELAGLAPLQVLRRFATSPHGLDEHEAQLRLLRHGENVLNAVPAAGPLTLLAGAVLDPFVVVLLALGVVSALTGDLPAVAVIGLLAVVSCGLRASQEYRADKAAAALRALTATTTTVLRRARPGSPPLAREVPTDQLVPGDIVALTAGDAVPADIRLLRCTGLNVSQALLTGESLPVIKYATMAAQQPAACDPAANLFDHPQLCLFGASVVGGTATGVVVATGDDTYFGATNRTPPHRRGRTAFDRGVRGVSWTLIRLMAATVPLVLVLTGISRDTWLQSAMFAVAVAVGLVPEMLPVVVTTTLIRAAARLRADGVMVKRLPAVHNIGAMDVLCIDKTGTLTVDRLTVAGHLDPLGRPDPQPLRYAALAARLALDHTDPPAADAIDEALIGRADQLDLPDGADAVAIHVLPFDPTRRRTTVALRTPGQWGRETLITKGAAEEVLDRCTAVRIDGRDRPLDRAHLRRLRRLTDRLHTGGLRLLAVAVKTRPVCGRPLSVDDETSLTLLGYVTLTDELKPGIQPTLSTLTGQGIAVKVLTGDHPQAAARLCREAGLEPGAPACGSDLAALDDRALATLAERTTLFARVDAQQKARIVTALRTAGHTVGYVGDGVNDAPALHAADVGACVEGAVDIARQSSDVLLTGEDLVALTHAVAGGRHAFANIIKYLKITVSSNVGNVCAVLAASATLPFLPMLPLQLLIQNLLFDLSQLSLAFDRTDPPALTRPRSFDTGDLTRFVLCFGALNTLADLATFAALRHTIGGEITPAGQILFHTGWFIENLITQMLAVHLLRSRHGPARWSWAARPVLTTTTAAALLSLTLPVAPIGVPLGLHPLPLAYYLWLAVILTAYAAALIHAKQRYQQTTGTWL
jgi:P-type Mg2+ transporter